MNSLLTGLIGILVGGFAAFAIAPQVFVTLERYNTDQERIEKKLDDIWDKLDDIVVRRKGC